MVCDNFVSVLVRRFSLDCCDILCVSSSVVACDVCSEELSIDACVYEHAVMAQLTRFRISSQLFHPARPSEGQDQSSHGTNDGGRA